MSFGLNMSLCIDTFLRRIVSPSLFLRSIFKQMREVDLLYLFEACGKSVLWSCQLISAPSVRILANAVTELSVVQQTLEQDKNTSCSFYTQEEEVVGSDKLEHKGGSKVQCYFFVFRKRDV